MKKIVFAVLIILLSALTFPSIPKVSAATTEDLWVSYASPEEIPSEPISDSPSGDYLDTTNPYASFGSEGATAEVGVEEGNKPLYVLVFGDEEERSKSYHMGDEFWHWDLYALLQLERGDEALVANFGIDIRILGFLEWDSDDSLRSMYEMWKELEADTEQYLRKWYNGAFVDAIIGITAQATPDDNRTIAGLSPARQTLDEWRIFTLLKWQVYWKDDNLVQHEVSHLFYAPDHPEDWSAPCGAMATHTHFVGYTWEDGLWIVLDNVACAYTSHDWCLECYGTIDQNKIRYLGPCRLYIFRRSLLNPDWLEGRTAVEVDGKYIGNTPILYRVLAGGYVNIQVEYEVWTRSSIWRLQYYEVIHPTLGPYIEYVDYPNGWDIDVYVGSSSSITVHAWYDYAGKPPPGEEPPDGGGGGGGGGGNYPLSQFI